MMELKCNNTIDLINAGILMSVFLMKLILREQFSNEYMSTKVIGKTKRNSMINDTDFFLA